MNRFLKLSSSSALCLSMSNIALASSEMAPANYDCAQYTPTQVTARVSGSGDDNTVSIAYSGITGRMPGTNANCADVVPSYDAEGYDADGYDRDGYDRDGYDRDGYDIDGYDRDGYDIDGYDIDGWSHYQVLSPAPYIQGYIFKSTGTEFGTDGYSKEGYDRNGKMRDGTNYCLQPNHKGQGEQFLCWAGPCKCYCYTSDTPIALADGSTKQAKDISYADELLVWDFDEGKFAKAKPLWIKVPEQSPEYNYMRFSDGSELKTINNHRIFNVEAGKFTYMAEETPLGTHTLNAKGEVVELVERKVVKGEVTYCNIITEKHINCFAGNVLTSCRLNNIYPIKDLKFVKDKRELIPYSAYAELDRKWYDGLRLAEQPQEINRKGDFNHNDKTVTDYVLRIISKQA